ncbi:MAG: NUDIX domain-containing protein [Chloroflexi bacterium]|nr:NUDIX domain-containing protein [Chloroflexota bacterium]
MQEETVDLRQPEIIFASQPQESVISQLSLDEPEENRWPLLEFRDYVNAFVVNESGEAMVLESFHTGNAWGSWQMIGRYLRPDEDPLTAVQTALLQRTGYTAEQWLYLGTFVADEVEHLGVGHFFCAQRTQLAADLHRTEGDISPDGSVRWVPLKHIKRALLDGRIAVINHAIAATMALVMCDTGC